MVALVQLGFVQCATLRTTSPPGPAEVPAVVCDQAKAIRSDRNARVPPPAGVG